MDGGGKISAGNGCVITVEKRTLRGSFGERRSFEGVPSALGISLALISLNCKHRT